MIHSMVAILLACERHPPAPFGGPRSGCTCRTFLGLDGGNQALFDVEPSLWLLGAEVVYFL
jgi:hypothetical protein